MRRRRSSSCLRVSHLLCIVVSSGCAVPVEPRLESVSAAWGEVEREAIPAHPRVYRTDPLLTVAEPPIDSRAPAIATVNDRPIAESRLEDLLMRSRGLDVLEQLIGLEVVIRAAEQRGINLNVADVDREYDRSLRQLVDPLSSITPGRYEREEAERLLDTVLAGRNVSREEYRLVMERNAYLRKIADSRITLEPRELRLEFARVFGARVQVRHIQLATLAEVERVRERLAAGEDFADLARRYSANTASADAGGLLEPFPVEGDIVPALFRQAALTLEPGAVSDAVRVSQWYHLIKLEKTLPPERRQFEQVRPALEENLRARRAESAMYELFEKLFYEANIKIHDPALSAAFIRKHQDRGR